MPVDVLMPKLGLTMQEGRIIEWLVPDGALVTADDEILLIETDKTETAVGSPGAGRLHQIGQPGQTFDCGLLIALLLAEGEDTPPAAPLTAGAPPAAPLAADAPPAAPLAADAPPAAPAQVGGRLFVSPNARRVAAVYGLPLATVRGTGPGGRIVSEDVEAVLAAPRPAPPVPSPGRPGVGSFVVATAAARQLADLLGIDLSLVPADPLERRVTRDAVAVYVRGLLHAPTERPATALPSAGSGRRPAPIEIPLLQSPTEVRPLSGMRGTIARRMHASLLDSAQLTLTMDADLTAVLADRAERGRGAESNPVPSITDYVVAATARALLRHPLMNAQLTADGIALLPEVHVGLAVALDGGLIVPVIRDAAERSLAELSAEARRVAGAARSNSLELADLEGGTFAVSALGTLGVDTFTPVINPPNVGILGIGRRRDDVALVDGVVVAVPRLTLSLTWDHRVLDGVPAAEFCRSIVALLAEPERLD